MVLLILDYTLECTPVISNVIYYIKLISFTNVSSAVNLINSFLSDSNSKILNNFLMFVKII